MNKPTHHKPRAHRGFSLIEFLVALLIFAIGLLGLAGMQATALTSVQESRQRLAAIEFTHQAVSAMWLVPDAELVQFNTGGARFTSWMAGLQNAGSGLIGLDESATDITVLADGTVTVTVAWRSVTDRGTSYAGGIDSRQHRHSMQTRIRHD
jgi:type IV pilus assembly protein PilV